MNKPLHTNRRAALVGAFVSTAALAVPATSLAREVALEADSDLYAAYAAWAHAFRVYEAGDDDEGPLYADLRAAERHLMSFSPTTARGMALMVLAYTSFGSFELEDTRPLDGSQPLSIMGSLYGAVTANDLAMAGQNSNP